MTTQGGLISVLTGFGLLLFALRYLTSSLDTHLSRKLRPLLTYLTSSHLKSFLFGCFSTSMVQASSITIIASMSLLNKNLFSLDRAIMIMLGSGLGSAFKTLFISKIGSYLSAFLIFGSATSYLALHSFWKKKLSEATLAIGISFLGLTLIETGLAPLAQTPFIKPLLTSLSVNGFTGALWGWMIGIVLAFSLQSSSSVLLLILGLASSNSIPFPSGASIILGANLGTTCTALIASIGQSAASKKLAFAHFTTKLLSSLWVLLFFRTHILMIENMFSLFTSTVATQLAFFHIIFNFMNALTWALMLPFLLRGINLISTPIESDSSLSFPESIRMLFTAIPRKASEDLRSALKQHIRTLHWAFEGLFMILSHIGSPTISKKLISQVRSRLITQESQLENIRLTLSELITNPCLPEANRILFSKLLQYESSVNLIHESLQNILDQVEFDMIETNLLPPPLLIQHLNRIRTTSNIQWEQIYKTGGTTGSGIDHLIQSSESGRSIDAPAIFQDLLARLTTLQLILQSTIAEDHSLQTPPPFHTSSRVEHQKNCVFLKVNLLHR